MYELHIQSVFSAAHAITVGGVREMLHGHDWKVLVCLRGDQLDDDGLVCDFHSIEEQLSQITGRFNSRNLNETPPFDRVNPTAELVAKHIFDELAKALPHDVSIGWVKISESPGCWAVFLGESEGLA